MNRCAQMLISKSGILFFILAFFFAIAILPACNESDESKTDSISEESFQDGVVNGIDTLTGLAFDASFEIVRANCITCHSSKLITQNRATREGWKGMLDWMRETQNLHDLGDNEEPILDYLAKHYAPENKGRRANIEDIEWYILDGVSD